MVTAPYPVRPTLTPLVGTLLEESEVRDIPNMGWLGTGEGLYDSYGSMTFGASPTFPCNGDPSKTLTATAGWVSGFRFGAYGGTTCRLIGAADDVPTVDAEVRRAFELGESTAVEAAFMATRFKVAAGAENAPAGVKKWDDPVDITPAGGAVKPKVGIALLEGWMGRRYVGLPVIHLPTVIASLVMGADGVALEEKVLRSKLGSVIVNGAGYDEPNTGPDGTTPTVGEKWLYASGAVLVDRGPLVLSGALNTSNNDYVRLVERAYIGSVDGPVAAVRVQVTL